MAASIQRCSSRGRWLTWKAASLLEQGKDASAAAHHARAYAATESLWVADEGIQVLNGRYGPYITNKAKNARVPKDREPKSLTLEECKELLAAAPERGRRGKKKVAKKTGEGEAAKKKPAKKKARKKTKKKSAKKKTVAKKAKKKSG